MIACQLLFSKSTFLYISPIFPFSLNMLFSIYAFLYECLLPIVHLNGTICNISSDVARILSQSRQMTEFTCFCPKIFNICPIWMKFVAGQAILKQAAFAQAWLRLCQKTLPKRVLNKMRVFDNTSVTMQ